MYLQNIIIENLGPIQSLTIQPNFDTNGNPQPILLVGGNGAGKSLALGLLADALIEAKKKVFTSIPEVSHEMFVRLLSQGYVRSGTDFSSCEVHVGAPPDEVTYREVTLAISVDQFELKYPNYKLNGTSPKQTDLGHRPLYREVQPITPPGGLQSGSLKNLITQSVFLYFPYFRYENPAWLNPESNVKFDLTSKYLGKTDQSVVQIDLLERVSQWLLDVLLDRELYEKNIHNILIPVSGSPASVPFTVFHGYAGPNALAFDLVNKILTEIYRASDSTIDQARLGIGLKGSRTISVIVKRGNVESVVAPTLRQMSSGELMIFSMFCTLIRTYDAINGRPPNSLTEISGVVLVDEIDLHLHITLQNDLLPRMIAMFPKIQFIMSTHSPFFPMGLSKEKQELVDVYSLPSGAPISATEFSEFQKGFDFYFDRNQQFKTGYDNLVQQIRSQSRPLVVTEGKTDWRHLKSALAKLKVFGNYANMDIDFLEYDDDVQMGDSTLAQMCKHFSKVPQNRKVIFVFDRDNPKIVSEMSDTTLGYKPWSDKIFSFCIPEPAHRSGYRNISIEFYYIDSEIQTVDQTTGRRLYFNNEIEIVSVPGGHLSEVRSRPAHAHLELDKKIYDENCDRILSAGIPVAHSKAKFANNILNGVPGYDAFNVTEFTKIFDLIEKIMQL